MSAYLLIHLLVGVIAAVWAWKKTAGGLFFLAVLSIVLAGFLALVWFELIPIDRTGQFIITEEGKK
jgi:hypothetical protein